MVRITKKGLQHKKKKQQKKKKNIEMNENWVASLPTRRKGY